MTLLKGNFTTQTVGSIPAYPLPIEEELPANVVDWSLDTTRAVLLVHDMQRYFIDFFEDTEMQKTLVSRVRRLIESARKAGVPVVYTAQPGSMTSRERGLIGDFWGPGMQAKEEHRGIVASCEPREGEYVATKWRYSAFSGNDLEDHLAGLMRDQLVLCGVYASIGCLITAADAYARDLQTFMIGDAMADFTRADHDLALRWAATRCATVRTTETVVAELKNAPSGASAITSTLSPLSPRRNS